MAQFAVVESIRVGNVDPSTGNITVDFAGTMVNGSQFVRMSGDLNSQTAFFAPTLANYVTALTTAVVNAYQNAFGVALARASVVMPQLELGQ